MLSAYFNKKGEGLVLLVKTLALLVTLVCLGYLGWKKPWILICVFAGSLFLDISRTWFPELRVIPDGLSLAKISSILLIGIAGWRLLRDRSLLPKLQEVLRKPLTKALLIFLAVGLISIFKSNQWQRTALEVFRLVTLFALFSDRHRALDIFKVLHWMGVALVPLAVYQGLTKHFLWYQDYATWVPPRVNTTFVDPNIFARYMVLAIIANLVLNVLEKSVKQRILYFATLFLLCIGLWMSYSRAGMLDVVLMLIALVLFLPNKKLVAGVGLAGLLAAGAIAVNPAVVQRFAGLKNGLYALDPGRFYLWNVAWEMFKTYPILGAGLGAFQHTFEAYFQSMMLPQFWVTRSHTTILTVAAEQGIVGLGALLFLWVCLLRAVQKLKPMARHTYVMGVGFFLLVLAVFISSQFEARFFEDPVIWLGMAMLLAIGHNKQTSI
jgi:putative inorganic carbon (hco3(-)) transporter